MKPRYLFSLWAALTALVAVSSFGADKAVQASPTASIKAHLDKARTDHIKGMLTGTPGTITSYYADTVRLMPEHQMTVLGKVDASAYHAAFVERFAVRAYDRSPIEMLDLGRQVVELGTFKMKLAPKNRGQESELIGKYLDVWEKSAGGELSLITAAWNYDHHTDLADALRFREVPAVLMAFQPRVPVQDRISFELTALEQLLEVTIAQHNAKVWSQFFANDIILLHNYNAPQVGRNAVDEFIAEHVKHLSVFEKLDLRIDRIDDLGEHVIEYASHVANWRNGEHTGVNTGKNLKIWRREADGALKIFRSIAMYD